MKLYPFADGHCDFLAFIQSRQFDIADPVPGQHIALPYLQQGNVKLQFFAMWPNMRLPQSAKEQCLSMAAGSQAMLKKHPVFRPLETNFDPLGEEIATVLTIEGGEAIGEDLETLHQFYDLGVRALTVTWNYPNALAHPGTESDAGGLTAFGREAVREMNALGIAIDVSHLNDAGIEDLLRLSNQPIFASHSNARALRRHTRCLSDDHIREIAQMGGVIGVNFCGEHLTDQPSACLEDVIAHLEQIMEVGGIRAACIGSDFDGIGACPEGLPNPSALQKIARVLEQSGYSQEEIYRVTYGNLHDYILQFC